MNKNAFTSLALKRETKVLLIEQSKESYLWPNIYLMDLQQELEWRGLLKQATNEKLFELYDAWNQTLYVGMDPTADSLHLWNFVGFMHAVQYMKRWNKLIFIVGWATGMIGDPWGKDSERSFLDEETLANNVLAITQQVDTVLQNITALSWHRFEFEVINNNVFYQDMGYLQFLRDVGKHITVNNMIVKETVKRRIEDPDKSISYTEFSYMLIQWYDFLRLYEDYACKLQIAGSDQWGNVVTGIELIRKKLDQEAYGATTPLILDATGKKFGKSEGNALWLSPEKNSPFVVYQYFMNTTDEDVERYLKLFTLLDEAGTQEILSQHNKDASQRYGQQQLAYYITQIIFGKQAADHAQLITNLLFGEQDKMEIIRSMDNQALLALNQATWSTKIDEAPIRLIDACTLSGLSWSNGEAKKLIKEWSIFINENKKDDIAHEITQDQFINNIVLLRKGKKAYKTILLQQ